MMEEVESRADIDSRRLNHSNTVIAKGLQNRRSNFFHLFNNVPRLPSLDGHFRPGRGLTRLRLDLGFIMASSGAHIFS